MDLSGGPNADTELEREVAENYYPDPHERLVGSKPSPERSPRSAAMNRKYAVRARR